MSAELRLAEMLCTRLCHDLTGPIGAVNNGAEFLQEEGFNLQGQAVELITTSAAAAVARLQFYRVAYGRVKESGEASLGDHQKLAQDFFAGGKITLDWPDAHGEASGVSVSLRMMRLLFNMLIIATGSLIKGGTVKVRIAQVSESEKRIEVEAQGGSVKWDAESETVLRGVDISTVTPKTVQLYVTHKLAEELHAQLTLHASDKELKFTALQRAQENSAAA